ncbi:MAG: 4Fe-4S binding protein [Clostridiales bacterium]|jgi:pyruvate ferredoxin oxidoreductase delta subunit|nr:4Fe-4S binding protein [Clostridiales bacterium]
MSKSWDVSEISKWGWSKHPVGAVIPEPATTNRYVTGGWRSLRPILDLEKCVHCFICFIFCPDSSILVENEKMDGFKLEHCKGCGICAQVCPKNAIHMMNEAEALGLEQCLLPDDDKKDKKEDKSA